MKKFLIVLLSLGLIAAFGMTASAADVKFSGSYYVFGAYESNPTISPDEAGYTHYSQAFFYQRLRLQPVFTIAEGLTFTARMDAMEKQWGNSAQRTGFDDVTSSRRFMNANQKIQESFEFERGYVTFMTGIGQFQVGYQNVDDWGTDYGDYSNSRPRILYVTQMGPVTLLALYEKVYENATGAGVGPLAHATDADDNHYAVAGIYSFTGGDTGLLVYYFDIKHARPAVINGYNTKMTMVSPYIKATFGPVYLESEVTYWFGKYAEFDQPTTPGLQDVDLDAWSAYLKVKTNLGPAYLGAAFGYASGNDLSDDTKNTTAWTGGGTNWSPALMLLNDEYNTRNGGNSAVASPALSAANPVTSNKYNTIIYNIFGGFNPTPKLNLEAALTVATVDKKALSKAGGVVTEAVSDKLGTEFDVTATYKLYDNLSYMVGAGYLWTGDYFKGSNSAREVDNDYTLLNKLTLTF